MRHTAFAAMALLAAACVNAPAPNSNVPFAPESGVQTPDLATRERFTDGTHAIVLGTGTPIPDVARAGPSIAILHDGQAYLFDLGAGAVRRAYEASLRYDAPGLFPSSICCVFFTHLHSDHIVDYPEFAATLWWRRAAPMRAFGPTGLQRITDGVDGFLSVDVELRTHDNLPIETNARPQVDVVEIEPGIVFQGAGISIEAFLVNHGEIRPAYGYRIVTDDKTIVISGDTTLSDTLIEKAAGADILFHEVISEDGLAAQPPPWQAYHRASHTTSAQIAEIGARARPGLIVLYHDLFYGQSPEGLLAEITAAYDGDIVLANDLDAF